MKPLFYLIIAGMVMAGCEPNANEEIRLNEFLKTAKHPIIVRKTKNSNCYGDHQATVHYNDDAEKPSLDAYKY